MLNYCPTLREIIEYYQRDDVLSIMYYQAVHWKSEMIFYGTNVPLNIRNQKELKNLILDHILKYAKNLDFDERLSEYPTFLVKSDRGKLVKQRYDWIREDDPKTWQEAFEAMKPVLDTLDTFEVYYQIQFSGNRSLHLRIPAEAFPKYFQKKPIASYETKQKIKNAGWFAYNLLHSAINRYLPPSGHSPFGMRMAYTTHPKTGLVALPLRRNELDIFHPSMAVIDKVKIDYNWFLIPENAQKKMRIFLSEAISNKKKKHEAWKDRR